LNRTAVSAHIRLLTFVFALIGAATPIHATTLDELVAKEEGVQFGACDLTPRPSLQGDRVVAVIPARFDDPVVWVTKDFWLIGVRGEEVVDRIELKLSTAFSPREVNLDCASDRVTVTELSRGTKPKRHVFLWDGGQLTALAAKKPKPLRLETLEQNKDFESGCACNVLDAKGRFLAVSALEETAPVIVRFDGKKRQLPWVSSSRKAGPAKKGDKFNKMYADGSTKLTLGLVTTFVCGPSDESCEVTRYAVDLVLEDGARKARIASLKGDCGC